MQPQLFGLPERDTSHRLAVKELPETDQPAYRIGHYGPASLSSIELVQLVTRCKHLDTAAAILQHAGSLAQLINTPTSELEALDGVGPAATSALKAALELGRRAMSAAPDALPQIKSPADAANILFGQPMATAEQEHLVTLLLDTKNHVLRIHTVYVGSLNTAVVRVGEVFRQAIRCNCAAIIVAHNHPSGDPTPSPEDVHVTRQIVEAGKLLDVDVLDHLVIGNGSRWVSLKERGLGF